MSRDQCEACVSAEYGGTRCPFAWKRLFYCDDQDSPIRVCQKHYHVLERYEREHGYVFELVRRWRES